ncbi:uncharacterized protein MYCGRDRAFT_98074 [Zymoseptoria tritici IPO323]|uniref:Uncharacterized protein n=1 Tax=Zymoseptoria tritici (strain CBS 115943 / IPO323) TaxID=336722 RepID=F9XS85_ZYMTI|nr:uncharacterized protein MYCGRDRAFT_98074 [Zymoseptoria tritici IPO323]EGP81884.1 hypothetical protein MYCGRDRAFT_98074 [Zymoseptoria tritici IPO323]
MFILRMEAQSSPWRDRRICSLLLDVLREIAASARYFWKVTLTQQIQDQTIDKDLNGFKRAIPDNETRVMALNELACEHGEGFLYYLPSRDVWKTNAEADILPVSRRTAVPG